MTVANIIYTDGNRCTVLLRLVGRGGTPLASAKVTDGTVAEAGTMLQ